MYNPTGEGGHQGGGVAAPIGAQLFGEILPYLEVKKDGETDENKKNIIQVPNVIGMNIKDAEKILKDTNLEISINNEQEGIDKENTVIKNQIPVHGINVNEGSKIYIDY